MEHWIRNGGSAHGATAWQGSVGSEGSEGKVYGAFGPVGCGRLTAAGYVSGGNGPLGRGLWYRNGAAERPGFKGFRGFRGAEKGSEV